MTTFQAAMRDYRAQLQKGILQTAYRGLMQYMAGLRTRFQAQYPQAFVSGNLYAGVMDMTYFSIVPKALKERSLKIAVVFVHETFRFEVWLSGANRQVQASTWQWLKQEGWDLCPLVADPRSTDAIAEQILSADPNFGDLQTLTSQIESGTAQFITDVEEFLTRH